MKSANIIFVIIFGVLISVIVWINVTELDEIIRAEGQVEPEEQIQVVQPRFTGRIERIYKKVGDLVEKDELVAELNGLDANSQLDENLSTIEVLMAEIARLKAEVTNKTEVDWPNELSQNLLDVQNTLFFLRKEKIEQEDAVLKQEEDLAESKVEELNVQILGIEKLFKLKEEERDLIAPLVNEGVEPKTRLLSIEQEIQRYENELNLSKSSIKATQIELAKTRSRREELFKNYRAQAFENLAKKQNQLRVTKTKTNALLERLDDTKLRAPISGVVTKVYPKGAGEIISGGKEVIEIAPFFKNIRIKGKLKPADITNLKEGQRARIALTSYDFTVFGTISGFVSEIAQNTSETERGEIFYEIWVESSNLKFSKSNEKPEILPGMLAQIEIIGKKRTIFEYLAKPVLETTSRAFTEK